MKSTKPIENGTMVQYDVTVTVVKTGKIIEGWKPCSQAVVYRIQDENGKVDIVYGAHVLKRVKKTSV